MTDKNSNNGRITNQKVYEMHAAVMKEVTDCRVAIAEVKTKQDDMATDITELKGTVGEHTKKISIIKGKMIVLGVFGMAGISVAVFLVGRLILGG